MCLLLLSTYTERLPDNVAYKTASDRWSIMIFLCLLLCLVRAASASNVSIALSTWQSGIASLYGGNDGSPAWDDYGAAGGSCGYTSIPYATWPFRSIAALPTTGQGYMAGPAQGCGTCYQISCTDDGPDFAGKCNPGSADQSVTIQITDSCPECQSNQFDVQAQTFGRIAPEFNGRMAMQYRRVTCTPDGNIAVRVDGNYAGAWLRIFIEQVAGSGGIVGVSIRSTSGTGDWLPMTNKFGASWESYSQPAHPSDLQITTDDGQTAVLEGIITDGASGVLESSVQLSSTPSAWAPTVFQTDFNPAVVPGSTSAAVVSQVFGAQVESEECCDSSSCYDINFAFSEFSCAQQKAFGHCNATFLTQPVKQQDATLEGLDIRQGYCSRTCSRCTCAQV